MTTHRHAFGSGIALLMLAAAAAADTARTIRVDCARGQSINAALAANADELIIEISGKCNEAVVVKRSRVTLRGTNPALDGLIGPVGDFVPLMEVRAANFGTRTGALPAVQLRNLSISQSGDYGLFVDSSIVAINNCLFADNRGVGGQGLHFTRSSSAVIVDSTFQTDEIFLFQSSVQCRSCTFSGNPGAAFIVSGGGSHGSLVNSSINGGGGAAAHTGADLNLVNTTVTGTHGTINVEQAQARVQGSTLSGHVEADYRSMLRLENTVQTANTFVNVFDQGAFVTVNNSTLVGPTQFHQFSRGSVVNGSHLGDLSCSTGADVACDGSETKGSSSCGLCP
jgi:hypothetical protein